MPSQIQEFSQNSSVTGKKSAPNPVGEAWLKCLRLAILGNIPGPTATISDLIQWYKATLHIQEEAAEIFMTRIAAMETPQEQRKQAMRAVLKAQEKRATRYLKTEEERGIHPSVGE
jgi:hypothetical protein